MTVRAIIADDEELARDGLRILLADFPDVEVVAECVNGRDALAVLRNRPADVLFLDIAMPGLDGVRVASEIVDTRLPALVFVTAHTEYAVQAFQLEAIDYLTKPVEHDRLAISLRRIRERIASHAAPVTQEDLQEALRAMGVQAPRHEPYPSRVVVHEGPKEVMVLVHDIEWVEAASYYSCLHVGKKNYFLRKSIKDIASALNPSQFVRVHRSAIVNVNCVAEVYRQGNSDGAVVLRNGTRIKMSKTGWRALLASSQI
jgi:two-component system, LytTR family, response regulator